MGEARMPQTRMPQTTREWAIWAWGVGGVVLILAQALWRLSPRALSLLDAGLTSGQIALTVAWMAFMAYTEAFRGFHLNFNPRVVVRAAGIAVEPVPWRIVLAPLVAMGLLYGTRRRLLVSRLLLAGIVGLVLIVRQLPDPWRGMVDAGVVFGLLLGMGSLLGIAARAALGAAPKVAAEFPRS